jgi:hypothetical protein
MKTTKEPKLPTRRTFVAMLGAAAAALALKHPEPVQPVITPRTWIGHC